MAYTKYSLTPANNTAAPPDGAPEGMLPSAVNDTMRDMMSQIRDVGDGVRDGTYTMTAPKITGGTITGVAITSTTGSFTTLSTSSTTTFTGLTASTALALDASKNVVSVTNTGTGNNVLSASPTLTGTIAGASLSLSSLTSGRVTYAGASGLLSDSDGLTFNGTIFQVKTGNTAVTQFRIAHSSAANYYADYNEKGDLTVGRNSWSAGVTTRFSTTSATATYTNDLSGGFSFEPRGSLAVTITGAGNVGIGTSSPLQRLDVSSSANEGANVALTKTNSGTADQNGQVLFFNNSHAAGTGRTAGVKCGQLVWQFSQPSSGALQFAGEIAVLAESQGGASTASSLNFYSSGGRGITIDSGTIVSMPAYGAGAATFSASGVISSVSDETWKTKDGAPTNTDAMLQKLEPGYWFYNEEKAPIFGQDRQLGFYAQNVREAIGAEAAPTPEEGKPWGYYDRSVLAVAVMSLKNALNTIEELKQRITTLENK